MKIKILSYIPAFLFCLSTVAFAMDADLWQIPQLPESIVIWQDKPLELNQIKGYATHLRSNLPIQEIFDFYQKNLQKLGWEFEGNLAEKVLTFVRNNRYIYLCIQDYEENGSHEVYVVATPGDLRICKMTRDYYLKDEIKEDAPGRDLPDVPRYPGSKRRFDLFAPNEGSVLIYETDGSPKEIAQFFRTNLKMTGWKEEYAFSLEMMQRLLPQLKDTAVLLFNQNDDTLLFNITKVPKNFPAQGRAAKRSFIIITRNMTDEVASPTEEVE